MAPRLELQALLESITDHVYLQTPENAQMKYPCIVYKRDTSAVSRADNSLYRFTWGYQVTVIDRDPDSAITEAVKELPLCTFTTHFAVNNLNHDVFTLYF